MTERSSSALELAGMGLVTAGIGMWSIPAAVVVAGVFAIVVGVLAAS